MISNPDTSLANMEVYTFGLNVDDCLYVDGAQYQYTPLYKVVWGYLVA